MDFSLTEEQLTLQKRVGDFVDKELKPIAPQLDAEARYSPEIIRKMADMGILGVGISEEYGGSKGGAVGSVIVGEELARGCAGTSTIVLASTSLTCYPIDRFGTDEQRRRFVVPLARGEKLGAFALTESEAGSDAGATATTATKRNGNYVLNGTKTFITNALVAGTILVFATIDKSLGHRGITAFIVEKDAPGFSAGREEHKLGIRASYTSEVTLDNCVVPEENRLGEEGRGLRVAMEAIDSSRISVAAQAVGIARAALETSVEYYKGRQQSGKPIANSQATERALADMATSIDAARLLTYRAAYLKEEGQPFLKEAAMSKVFAAETARAVATKAMEIYGRYGYIKGYPAERHLRDAKITEIYEGTSEMQRMTIYRVLLR